MTGILGAYRGNFGRVTVLDITRPITNHAHPDIHMLFALSGAPRGMQIESERIHLTRDNWILVNPWQRHFDIAEQCISPTQILALYINRDWCNERFMWPTFAGSQCPMSPAIRQRVDMLARLVGNGESLDSAWVEPLVASIMIEAARLAPTRQAGRGAMDFRIRRALMMLKDHAKVGSDFQALARSVGLSRSRFFEQFKNSIGIAPNMYVDGLLIERAIGLLEQSDQPLDDISETLGFSAQSSFTRFFKERVGFPPSTLRQASSAHQ